MTHDFTKRMFALEDDTPARKPTLALAAIEGGGQCSSSLCQQPALLADSYNPNRFDQLIRRAFEEAAAIELPGSWPEEPSSAMEPSPLASAIAKVQFRMTSDSASEALNGWHERIEISNGDRALVTAVLAEIGIEVPDDLFNVGGLHRNKFVASSLYLNDGIEGTNDEEAKYGALQKLIGACKSYGAFKRFLNAMGGIVGLPLLIENNGSAPATHVVADLLIPQQLYVPIETIPIPGNAFIARELDDADEIEAFARCPFEIPKSYAYHDYEDSRACLAPNGSIPPMHARTLTAFSYGRSTLDRDDYREEIEYCFDDCSFKPVPGEDAFAVSVSFDRVQQNAAYAFPAILPLKRGPFSLLRYRINSDELDEPIVGEIGFEGVE